MGKTQGEKKIGLGFMLLMSYMIFEMPKTSNNKAKSQTEIEKPMKIDSSPTKKLATKVVIETHKTTTMLTTTQMRGI